MVTDVLAPNGHQDIGNHHADKDQSMYPMFMCYKYLIRQVLALPMSNKVNIAATQGLIHVHII